MIMRRFGRVIVSHGCGHCCGVHYCGSGRYISSGDEFASLDDEEKMLEEELAAIKEEKAALKDQSK
jgi:hypothetical protein